MRRRLRAGSAKPRHRKATAAKRPSRVEGTRGVTSSAPKEESEIARLRRQLSEARRRHRRAKQAFRESDPRIRRLVDANIIGIFTWDFDGRILEANEAFLRIVGYEHEDLVAGGLRWTDHLTAPEWRDQDTRLIQELKATGTLQPFEKEYLRKDGRPVPVLIGLALEEGGDQGVAFVLDLTQRKRAEDALRESERKHRQLIESVPCHFWSTNANGELTYVNQRLLDYFGVRFEDQKRDTTVLHPDDVAETERALNHAFQTGESFQRVHRLRRADGEYRWHRVRAEPQRDHSGNIIQWYGFSVDIDEGKKAEDALRHSEVYLAEAQRLSHTGSFGWTPSTGDFHWSDETFRILEYDSSVKPTMERVVQRVHPDDLAIVRQVIDEASRGGKVDITHRLLMPDGSVKFLHVLGYALKDAAGNLEIVGAVMDVTERKRAEQALRESEARFRDYAETASDWFCEMGPDYKFTLLSENAFGSGAADRIGTACWDHALDLETEPEKWRLLQETVFSRKPFRDFVYRGMSSDGSPMYVRASGKPLFDANGEFRGYRGTCTDVTALRTVEAEARESERRYREAQLELAHANRAATMGELTASITHEVNQPITAAVTYALAARRFLSAEPPDFREVDKALSLIVKEGIRAGEVVGRVRALIKKTPARKDAVAINDAILEVVALTRTEAANNSVSVRTQLAEGLPRVQGDRVQLQQVMLNLIVNAIQAMSGVGEGARELQISIDAVPSEGSVRVGVRDTGPGLSPESLSRLFEPFYSTKPEGMGMGLSICRSIIEAHGGRLWAIPCEPQGALFQFTIPAT